MSSMAEGRKVQGTDITSALCFQRRACRARTPNPGLGLTSDWLERQNQAPGLRGSKLFTITIPASAVLSRSWSSIPLAHCRHGCQDPPRPLRAPKPAILQHRHRPRPVHRSQSAPTNSFQLTRLQDGAQLPPARGYRHVRPDPQTRSV